MSAASEIDRMHALVGPIASDLALDVYDIERRGGTIRITLDTLPGSDGGITLDSLSLATRLISRELDHEDPIAGQYTLEITSPGLERQLRTPAHFQREVGKTISVRLRDSLADPRRLQGSLVAADDRCATLLLDDGTERSIVITEIDKARTVFEWGPKPKPGKQSGKQSSKKAGAKSSASTQNQTSTKEKQPS
ncbi:MAG TPA: ribosome maturation factor RimP [Ilumatobacteraceae bacterium]|nr:ribosome maturation factor RimP [Ilumatobacteraceae bacterium]